MREKMEEWRTAARFDLLISSALRVNEPVMTFSWALITFDRGKHDGNFFEKKMSPRYVESPRLRHTYKSV